MTLLNLPHETTQPAIAALRARYLPGFYVLPYNRFKLERSQHWWLSPTSEKAAYRYGKVMFTTSENCADAGQVFVGFKVEKGVAPGGVGSANEVMDESWLWHRLLELANGPLAAAIEQAHDAIGGDLQLYVDCGILGGGSAFDWVLFDVQSGHLSQKHAPPGGSILSRLAASTDFIGFADALRTLDGPGTAWHWIDLLVGTRFTLDPHGPDDTGKCAALLNPFRPWMRDAR